MKNIRFLILGSFICLSLGACQNTVDGFGQDMERAGKKIQGEKVESNNVSASPSVTTYSSNKPYELRHNIFNKPYLWGCLLDKDFF